MSGHEFVPLAERIIEGLLASDPLLAMRAGDHRFDDRLPDYSADGVAARVDLLRDASAALSGVDVEALEPGERIDHAQLMGLVERQLFELVEVRQHEWNPLTHNPGALLNALIERPYAPAEDRLEALAGRLEKVPDALAAARAALGDCPQIHLETGIDQFLGAARLVRNEIPPLLDQAPSLRGSVEPTIATAAETLDEFAGWLRARLAAGEPERDARLGRRLWEARLWHTLDTELTAAEILRRARDRLEQVTDDIRAAAVALVGGKGDDDTVRAALNRLADEHPDNGSIVALARHTLAETTDFVRERELVSLVDDACEIREMPEFARGVAVAYCESPGPLEAAAVPTFYCIAPTPTNWSPARVESFYREYNNHMVRNLTVHEAMPGHYLQLAHARRFRGSTRARAITTSGPFVEGWAVYAEEMMADAGFGGLPIRLQQLKMQLRTIINALLDQQVHCEDLTEGEALALMTQRGFQEEGEAAGKWRRAQLTSTQLSTYFVGYLEVAEIAGSRPSGTALGQWHDRMLSQGTPSPRHLRALLR